MLEGVRPFFNSAVHAISVLAGQERSRSRNVLRLQCGRDGKWPWKQGVLGTVRMSTEHTSNWKCPRKWCVHRAKNGRGAYREMAVSVHRTEISVLNRVSMEYVPD